jgi:hypothetical protein
MQTIEERKQLMRRNSYIYHIIYSLISRPNEETRRVFCISKEKEKARNHLKQKETSRMVEHFS